MNQINRFPAVRAATGCSRTTIHRRIHDGLFTAPVNLGAKAVGWPAHEVEAINAARIAGVSNEEVRALVQRLHAARKEAPNAAPIAVQGDGPAQKPAQRLHVVARKGEEARG